MSRVRENRMHGSMGGERRPAAVGHAARRQAPLAYPTILEDAERGFCDLWNLVCDPATLLVAWSRVSANRGLRTAGIDGKTRSYVEQQLGVARLLQELREELKTGRFRALPVRERMIPKRDGRMRRLGIPNVARPGGADGPQARDRADLRERLLAVKLWLQARSPGAGRDRRDRPLHEGPRQLRVDHRDGHRGVS